jgi:hypothetical protein
VSTGCPIFQSIANNKVHFHPAATRPTATARTAAETKAEFDTYFASQAPDVSTTLLIPLVRTPMTRVPLAHTFVYDRHPLVSFLELSVPRVDTEQQVA